MSGTAPPRLLQGRFVTVVASGFCYFTGLGMLSPVLPPYVKGPLGGGSVAVGVAVGAFFLAAVVGRPGSGRLGDRFDARAVMVAGAALVSLSVAGYAIAESLPWLVLCRFLTGLGEAAFFVAAATQATSISGPLRAGEAASYFGIAVYGGFAFGPVIGESVHDATGYRTVWIVSSLVGLVAVALATLVPDPRPPRPRSATRLPVLHRAGFLPGTLLGLGTVGLAGFNTFVPLYVETIGLSGSKLVFLEYGLVSLALRLLGARLPDRLGALRMATIALVGSATGLTLIAGLHSKVGLFVGASIFAVGGAYLFPTMLALSVTRAPEAERSAVVGTFTAFFDLSQFVGALSLGGLLDLTDSYRAVFLAGASASLTGLVLVRRTLGRPAAGAAPAGAAGSPAP